MDDKNFENESIRLMKYISNSELSLMNDIHLLNFDLHGINNAIHYLNKFISSGCYDEHNDFEDIHHSIDVLTDLRERKIDERVGLLQQLNNKLCPELS